MTETNPQVVNQRTEPAFTGNRESGRLRKILSLPWWELSGRTTLAAYLMTSGVVGVSFVWRYVAGTDPHPPGGGALVAAALGMIMLVSGISAAVGKMRMPAFIVSFALLYSLLLPFAAQAMRLPTSMKDYGLARYLWNHALYLMFFVWLIARRFQQHRERRLLLQAISILLALVFAARLPADATQWGTGVGRNLVAPPAVGQIEQGQVVPNLRFEDLHGGPVSLGSSGKLYVINFWTTWCAPCRKELPELVSVAAKYAGQDSVCIMAVNVEDLPLDRLIGHVQDLRLEGLKVCTDPEKWSEALGINTIPVTLMIRNRRVISRIDGYREGTVREIEQAIQEHLHARAQR